MTPMQYRRPAVLRPAQLVRALQRPAAPRGLAGLGDLGDAETGIDAVPNLMFCLRYHIVAKASAVAAGALQPTGGLANYIGTAALYVQRGQARQLPPDEQANWDTWGKASWDSSSDYHVYWKFGALIAQWANQLVPAALAAQQSGALTDPEASKAVYLLMDTTQQGTTWYGGTTTTSKLSNPQWGDLFERLFNVIARGIVAGVLSFTHLDVLCRAMLTAPVQRRFPAFSPPPGNLPRTDPRAVAFREAMRQLGYTQIVSDWGRMTLQAWVAQDQASDAQIAQLQGALSVCNFLSGKALYDQIVEKMRDYVSARNEAVAAFQAFDQLQNGPLADDLDPADVAKMREIKQQFADVDQKTYNAVSPAGLWPEGAQAGVSGLGFVQMIVAGAVLVGLAGMVVWAIGLMTSVSRQAAAQTRATTDNILATVDELKASCMRTYQASAKTGEDEETLQKCLAQTEALYKEVPDPPSGNDPLGLKWIAVLGLVGIGGFIAYQHFGKRKS